MIILGEFTKSNHGYSLVELLVGLTIGAIVTTAGSFMVTSQFISQQQARNAGDAQAAKTLLEMIARGRGCDLSTAGLQVDPPSLPSSPNYSLNPATPLNAKLSANQSMSGMTMGMWNLQSQSIQFTSCHDTSSPHAVCNPAALPNRITFAASLTLSYGPPAALSFFPGMNPWSTNVNVVLYARKNAAGAVIVDGCRPGGGGGGSTPTSQSWNNQDLCNSIGPGLNTTGSNNPNPANWIAGQGRCDFDKQICLSIGGDWQGGSCFTGQLRADIMRPQSDPLLCQGAQDFLQGVRLGGQGSDFYICGRQTAPPSCFANYSGICSKILSPATPFCSASGGAPNVPEITVVTGATTTTPSTVCGVSEGVICDSQCTP